MASYYFQRGEAKVGPFSLEEMLEFLKDGRVGYTDRVVREGEDQWWPVHSIPELEGAARGSLVQRGVASDPPQQAPTEAARPRAARGSTAGRVMAKSAWTPGQPPRRPGVFLRFAQPLPEIASLVEGAGAHWAAVESGRSRVRWSLLSLLVGLTFLAPWIDRQAGYDATIFSSLVPFFLVGAALVLLATRRQGWPAMASVWERVRRFGCFGLFVLPIVYVGGGDLLRALVQLPLVAAFLAGLVFLILRLRPRAAPAPTGPSWSARLSAVQGSLEALRDDAAPGRPASGWLDLTGAEQRHKLLASGKALSGAPAEVYRDDWWSLSLPLRDGNRLRITASDRLKLKRGHWRTRRKAKWKPPAERRLCTVSVRLRVNPAVYRIVAEPPTPYVTIAGDSLSTAFDASERLDTKDLVRSLSVLYKRLEPISGKASGG